MTITLPDEMRDELERKAKAAGHTTVDIDVLELVRDDDPDVTEIADLAMSSLTP